MYIKKLIHPEFFQGNMKKKKYFEGWYYKLVSTDELHTLAFIPGISLNKKDPHAFIQVFVSSRKNDQTELKTHYLRFDVNDFKFTKDNFSVSIGKSTFSKESININIEDRELSIKGKVLIDDLTPIKKSIYSPNIMGPFGYINFMECYHGIVSMNHHLSGELLINHETINFQNSKGYIEKDWGTSFPRAYVWMQSNHFNNLETSFMFSYADIPFIGFYFKGLIVNLIYHNKEYRFSTYNRTKVLSEKIEENQVFYTIKKGHLKLEIYAKAEQTTYLSSPRNGEMIEQIKEGLSGQIEIKLYIKNKLHYHDIGKHAGIEIIKNGAVK